MVQPLITNVPDDPDDGAPLRALRRVAKAHAFAHRPFPPEEPPRQAAIEDGHPRRPLAIPRVERTPIQKRRAERAKVEGIRRDEIGDAGGHARVLALVVATVGIYGLIAYSVAQRTHEIGVRIALGAARRDVLGLVVGQGLRLTVLGVALGVAGALALTRLMQSLLFEVSPQDPATFVAAAAFLLLVGLLASYLPARRAAMVDPAVALRVE